MVIDDDAVFHFEPGGLGERVVRHRAGADHDEIGGECIAILDVDREAPVRQRMQAATTAPRRTSTPCARWRSSTNAEVSSSQTRASRRGAISITAVLTPISAAEAATSSPISPPPITISDLLRPEMRLERERFGLRAQVIDAARPAGNIGSTRLNEPVASTSAS